MSHVYLLRNSDTDMHVFDKEEHLLPSVRISYSKAHQLKIEPGPFDMRYVTFKVSGTWDKEGVAHPFEETITFHRLPVWDEPSHL